MGFLNLLRGDRIYLDANIWIYFLEGLPLYGQPLNALFEAADAGSLTLFTSELTLAEILVRPTKEGNFNKQQTYANIITNVNVSTAVPIDRSILIASASLRASTKLKLPDAIHAATAIATNCTTFLTNDQQFRTVPGLHTVLLSQATEEFINDDEN